VKAIERYTSAARPPATKKSYWPASPLQARLRWRTPKSLLFAASL